jgi:hypothetical protein
LNFQTIDFRGHFLATLNIFRENKHQICALRRKISLLYYFFSYSNHLYRTATAHHHGRVSGDNFRLDSKGKDEGMSTSIYQNGVLELKNK